MNEKLIATLKQALEYLKESNIDKPHFIKEATKVLKAAERNNTTKQQTIKYAEGYLAGDGDTEDAIKAIIAHEDQDDLIDNVDGVDVWEKVEYSFTCKDFLESINYIASDWK